MQNDVKNYDVVVIGGGLAGVCAAIASARNGVNTLLVHDRSVLGGNSSGEIGVRVQGADELGHYRYSRETGIIDKIFAENAKFPNPQCSASIWSLVLWAECKKQEKLTVMFNAVAKAPQVKDSKIISIQVEQYTTEKSFQVFADVFIDCSGDGRVAFEAGADFMYGRESQEAFGESLAVEKSDNHTMGSTIFIRARDAGHPVPFECPSWAKKFSTDDDFPGALADCPHSLDPVLGPNGGYWWLELGGLELTIEDSEDIRDELYRYAIGVWDHIKNQADHGAKNLVLEWVGTLPGRRESRRFVGDYILTQQDVENAATFDDVIAYGGWHIDLHNPGGVTDKTQRYWKGAFISSRYSIPYRSIYSRNVDNLLFAGRNISATHVAFGSSRVMGTCALVGQAAGNAAAMCHHEKLSAQQIGQSKIKQIQQDLLQQGCYLPWIKNTMADDIAQQAKITASSEACMEFFPPEKYLPLDVARAENFVIANDNITKIYLDLKNESVGMESVKVEFYARELIDDFASSNLIKVDNLEVLPGERKVCFNIDSKLQLDRPYGIKLYPRKSISWGHSKHEVPGTQAGELIDQLFTEPGTHKFMLRTHGTYCFGFDDENRCYIATNVISGVTRPEVSTNMWISDKTLPQWIDLTWDTPRTFDRIFLTFDNNLDLSREKWAQAIVAPELVKSYTIFIEKNSQLHELLGVAGNYQRQNIHHFPAVTTTRLRVLLTETHGATCARLFEVRVY